MIQNSIESLTIVLELQSRKNVIQLEQIYILDYINCILLFHSIQAVIMTACPTTLLSRL